MVVSLSADFQENYNARGCQSADNRTSRWANEGETATVGYPAAGGDNVDVSWTTSASSDVVINECLRETSLLYLLLMLGTAWLGLSLYNFTKTYVVIGVRSSGGGAL